ncbi:hypothetical protein BPAE_0080g00180 [Botrytis paeoniae]|uniref:Uncharacterized protein n=1 Tax=Botrytis paeoniae TaxID=278948 RepID=A0A4Z1FUM8_9HELO|nr:hypothetical protein BPAE_0080g00180 [Botrytis paeoniae]
MVKRVEREPGSAVAKTPADIKEETLIPMIMDGPSAVQYQSRIPFDFNYYGDFYFTSRPGPFRFMDLPTEVQTIIFQLIASVILYFDPESKIYVNSITIGHHASMPDSEFLHWAYLKWIRMLANVSTQFRLELGSVIWERSRIYCNDDKDESALGQLLTASPGIAKGLKELVIEVIYQECSIWEKGNDESIRSVNEIFSVLIQPVSQKLNLEYLTMRLGVTKSALVKLAEGEGLMKILTKIRDLKVTKGFQIEMSGYGEISNDGRELDPEFKIEWEPRVREALLPENLRLQTPETDRSHYLASRAKEQEIGAIE